MHRVVVERQSQTVGPAAILVHEQVDGEADEPRADERRAHGDGRIEGDEDRDETDEAEDRRDEGEDPRRPQRAVGADNEDAERDRHARRHAHRNRADRPQDRRAEREADGAADVEQAREDEVALARIVPDDCLSAPPRVLPRTVIVHRVDGAAPRRQRADECEAEPGRDPPTALPGDEQQRANEQRGHGDHQHRRRSADPAGRAGPGQARAVGRERLMRRHVPRTRRAQATTQP